MDFDTENQPPADPPPYIPEHQMLRRIGFGSYGHVWLARSSIGGYRAVKVVFRNAFGSQRPFERELQGIQKFEPISRLHEGFIDILQVGINETGGYFYYVMELGDDQRSGQTIDPEHYAPRTLATEIAREGRISLEQCLHLGVSLTHALSDLHRLNLVHRDVKPSNIIFINGIPKLADIGLVAELNDARSYVGTEGFIPPEGPGTAQADIYSLGKVLYEASTGKDRNDFPELPSDWSLSAEYEGLLELNEVILTSCHQESAKRYGSARDMQADLLVILNGKSVKRLRMLERRLANLRKVAGVVAIVVGIISIIVYSIFREVRSANEARKHEISANVSYGNRAMEAGDLLAALPYFAEALRLEQHNKELQTTHRLRFGSVLSQCPKLTQMWFAKTRVNDACFSPDGKRIVFAEYFGKVEAHDIQTGELKLAPFGPEDGLHSVCCSSDGRFIVTTTQANTTELWDAKSFRLLKQFRHSDKVFRARFSPDAQQVITSCLDGQARVWDIQTGQIRLSLRADTNGVAFADFSHDGKLIATASFSGNVCLWNAASGEPTGLNLPHTSWVTYLNFSPDDQRLITACHDHKAYVWDLPSGRKLSPALEHDDAVISSEFSSDGLYIITGSFDGTARLWRTGDLQPLSTNPILRHGERLTHASLSPDCRQIVTCCTDGSVRLWDLAGCNQPPERRASTYSEDGSRYITYTSNRMEVLDASTDKVICDVVATNNLVGKPLLNCDGHFILAVTSIRTGNGQTNYYLGVWSVETAKTVGSQFQMPHPQSKITLSKDGLKVVICSDRIAQVWAVQGGQALTPPLRHDDSIILAFFNPSSDLFVTLSGTKTFVRHSTTGELAYSPLEHPVSVDYAEFSEDGEFLVTCCSDQNLTKCFGQVWQARTGHAVGGRLRHADGVLSASFSPQGNYVLTASEDFSAKVWETKTGKQIGLPLRHRHRVRAGAFNSNCQWVATVSSDKTARVWNPQDTEALTPPLKHLTKLIGVRFSLDSKRLITFDKEGFSYVWCLPIDRRPIADLAQLSDLLSGGQFSSNWNSATNAPDAFSYSWNHLRAKYPTEFATTIDEIERWHNSQAEQSELGQNWFAAAFHLSYLRTLAPADSSITSRLAQAMSHIAPH